MNQGYLALWVIGFILLLIDLGSIISLLRKGDERRQLIVWKSSMFSFGIIVTVLLLNCLTTLLQPLLKLPEATYTNHSSSFSLLTMAAFTYFLALLYNKKKLGD